MNHISINSLTLLVDYQKSIINKLLKLADSSNIKPLQLFKISLLISILLTLPRVLAYLEITDLLAPTFTRATIADTVFRGVFYLLYSYLIIRLNSKGYNWVRRLKKWQRNSLSLLGNFILFVIATLLFFHLYEILVGQIMPEQEQGLMYFVNFVILVVLFFLVSTIQLRKIHEQDLLDKEALKQEKLKNELNALKSQVRPHFLFNSLNSLNGLIGDNKEATTFVNKLSYLYRYILQSNDNDLVSVQEELSFLESYLFLIKTRYKNRFQIDIDIPENYLNEQIPSLALQILVENAVKHNEISETNPLHVTIDVEDDAIVVRNKIIERKTLVSSTGYGLVNLNKRYQLLKDIKISISNTNNFFTVKLPLCK
ncbi:histidine kinase [Spongiivirga sp. MCCC 1A20706]|uniref:sensor histidine kinase n=1 Tax=Spongiivirga sp. MCCC 1A20706 TaxID=3160963 RepID=UPI003977D1E7